MDSKVWDAVKYVLIGAAVLVVAGLLLAGLVLGLMLLGGLEALETLNSILAWVLPGISLIATCGLIGVLVSIAMEKD